MGQITSSVGLVSGLPTQDLINQLMVIEGKTKTKIEQNNAILQSKQAAYQAVNAKLISMRGSTGTIAKESTFHATKSSTSNESVLTVSSTSTAIPGNYSFIVNQLVTAQQTVSHGFSSQDTALGMDSVFTFESGDTRLDSKTELSTLNGGEGVKRGQIRIVDRAGNIAFVDLSTVVTVDDVVDQINNCMGVNVVASISNDSLVITDNTGQTTHNLIIEDVGKTGTAASLGLAGSSNSGQIMGARINTIGDRTNLNYINDGNGVRINHDADDFKIMLSQQITQPNGETATASTEISVNLDGAQTIGDVIDKINKAAQEEGMDLNATVGDDGVSLKLEGTSGSNGFIEVVSLNNSKAAEDLGLVGGNGNAVVDGKRLIASINSTLLSNLNGGKGLGESKAISSSTELNMLRAGQGVSTSGDSQPDLVIKNRLGQSYNIDIDGVNTVGELMELIEGETEGSVSLKVDGNKLKLVEANGGELDDEGNPMAWSVEAPLGGPDTVNDLGFAKLTAEDEIVGGDLNPNYQEGLGTIRIQNKTGSSVEIDLSSAKSVSDILTLINSNGVGVTAKLNSSGNGIQLQDSSGGGGNIVIEDITGGIASSLHIAGSHSGSKVNTGDLQHKYISEATTLEDLGVPRGKFTITDSSGKTSTVDLTQGDEQTLEDVIGEINSRGLKIHARINDTGDGLIIEDTGPGTVKIKVEEDGSKTAEKLGILGESKDPGDDLNGSFATTVKVESDDTLKEITDKINDAGLNIRATIINDGSGAAPYRLSFTTREEGTSGAFVFDDGGADIGAFNLAEAQDAVVFYGTTTASEALVITSSSNTLKNLIPGVTVSLKSASQNPVQVTIDNDDEAIKDSLNTFIEGFNGLIDTINQYDTYDQEKNERGLLLNDFAVSQVQQTLFNSILYGNPEVPGKYKALGHVGVKVNSEGHLEVDSSKLQKALDEDRDAVVSLFTYKKTEKYIDEDDDDKEKERIVECGIGVEIEELIKKYTDEKLNPIDRQITAVEQQIELNKERIELQDKLLENKRTQLEKQFLAMEKAISSMQQQSASIGQIQSITMPTKK